MGTWLLNLPMKYFGGAALASIVQRQYWGSVGVINQRVMRSLASPNIYLISGEWYYE